MRLTERPCLAEVEQGGIAGADKSSGQVAVLIADLGTTPPLGPQSSPGHGTTASSKGKDADWAPLDGADWAADLAVWQAECEQSRLTAAAHDLNDTGVAVRGGERAEFSLRWIYNHMIEEYARHNGHADLIRELVDGTVG
jgi:Protein of unknown function (DUF664)